MPLLTAVLVALLPGTAAARPACWKTLLNDWYDGRIDGVYPVACYRTAISHLPEDVRIYSSAPEDLTLALQRRIDSLDRSRAEAVREAPAAAGRSLPLPLATLLGAAAILVGGGLWGLFARRRG